MTQATPDTEVMPVLRDVIRRAAHFDPLMEALREIINAADNGEWEPIAVAIGEARAALLAAEEATS